MIYLDHASTTPMDKRVVEAMLQANDTVFGNPSSIHRYGRMARKYIDGSRRFIANQLQVKESEIIFTSGGTEANNLALIGTAKANRNKGNHIITTKQEHHAVLRTVEQLEEEGFEVSYLPVNAKGRMDIRDFENALTDHTILVSIMAVNNETGVIQPLKEIGEVLKNHQAYFHTDAVQAFSMLELNVNEIGVDLLTATSHKINGPKGIGMLYCQSEVPIKSIQFGGEQERKRRAGTENTLGIIGFEKAVQFAMDEKMQRKSMYQNFKQHFIETLKNYSVSFEINGEMKETVPNIINISFPGTNVESLLTNFDLDGVSASSGSACTAGSIEPSHVLVSMYGENDERIYNSVRFSFGILNTMENVEEAATIVAKTVKRLTKEG